MDQSLQEVLRSHLGHRPVVPIGNLFRHDKRGYRSCTLVADDKVFVVKFLKMITFVLDKISLQRCMKFCPSSPRERERETSGRQKCIRKMKLFIKI